MPYFPDLTLPQATLCDALVAWRFHVVYQRKVWAKYAPAALVALTAGTCFRTKRLRRT